MKNFYDIARDAINTSKIDKKSRLLEEMVLYCSKMEIEKSQKGAEILDKPSYSQICQIVLPKNLPRRKAFDTTRGLATLLHSIAHIEYSAIDLAIDALYRFPDTPLEFKLDWLEVAEDEIRHFKMIEEILQTLGYKYGDFPVHQGLFDALVATSGSLLERMAVVPRHYEASGLDANPQIIKKLKSLKIQTPELQKTVEALEIIYQEELSHVKKGDKWFKYLCREQDLDAERVFFEILDKFDLIKSKRGKINVEARLEVGFSCRELRNFGVEKC